MRLIDILLAENAIPDYVQDLPKFNVTNVSDYYYSHKKEFWGLHEFPYPMPPYDSLWVEYRGPREIYSDELGATDTLMPPNFSSQFGAVISRLPTLDWFQITGALHIIEGDKLWNTIKKIDCRFRLAKDDECIEDIDMPVAEIEEEKLIIKRMAKWTGRMPPRHPRENPDSTEEDILAATRLYTIHPVLMAFSFLHCKNVEIVKVEIPPQLNKKRASRGKKALQDYHIINVLPLNVHKQVRRSVQLGDKIHTALGKVKFRIGTFATYRDEDGHRLFGKYSGRYWRPAILRTDESPKYDVKVKDGKP